MTDILEFIDELKELHTLYNEGELRNIDFETKIQQLERRVEVFERDMQEGMFV